jgi:hypothetical protein
LDTASNKRSSGKKRLASEANIVENEKKTEVKIREVI